MKKILRAFLSMALVCVLLSGSLVAFAAGDAGIFNVTPATGYTSSLTYEAQTAAGAKVNSTSAEIKGYTVTNFYAKAEKMKISVKGLDNNAEYVIFVQKATGDPTAENLVYVDQQKSSSSGTVTFTAFPKSLESNVLYTVYLSGTSLSRAKIMEFRYNSGILPGDINGDGKVNNKDLTRLAQHLAKKPVETPGNTDVNGDGKVNNKDLTRLAQYLAKKPVEIF